MRGEDRRGAGGYVGHTCIQTSMNIADYYLSLFMAVSKYTQTDQYAQAEMNSRVFPLCFAHKDMLDCGEKAEGITLNC